MIIKKNEYDFWDFMLLKKYNQKIVKSRKVSSQFLIIILTSFLRDNGNKSEN